MSLDKLRPFNDLETLREIRTNVLNPLSLYVKNTVVPNIESTKEDVKKTYKEIRFDPSSKKFTLVKTDPTAGDEEIDLGDVIPQEFEGLSISDGKGGTYKKVKSLVVDSAVLQTAGSDAVHVDFDWDSLIPLHQRDPSVQIGTGASKTFTKIKFTGNEDKVSISGDTLSFAIPNDPTEFTAKVDDGTGGGTEKSIKKILIEGNTTGSEITDDGELKLKLPTGGAGATGGNFQGFFDTEGDLVSTVDNPVNGKSFAFVKDALLKGKYYTPYMYVGNSWTEAPTDPAITFEPESSAGPQGVFSIKPDTRIKLDPKGQLDLSLLGEGHFVGFFDNQDELNQACPNPFLDKSFAYVKIQATDVYSGMKYTIKKDGTKAWVSVTPYGLISAVQKDPNDGSVKVAEPIFGIEKNDAITVDSGVITIKAPEEQSIKIVANVYPSGIQETAQVTEINFTDGAYVEFIDNNKTALIRHPHKTIHYSPTFEQEHSSAVFLGNIFYDLNTHKWMGYTPAPLSGDPKWTHIAHRGMSEEVKSLVYRYPEKAPTVLPSAQSQDLKHWTHNGVTYSDNGSDVGLGSNYSNVGVYIETIVQDTLNDDLLSPKNRIQIAYTETRDSEIFIRFSDPNATTPSSPWKGWVKTSVSPSDIVKHNEDLHAHTDSNKFYKVYTLNSLYKDVKTAGFIYDRTTHVLPVADNRGIDSSSFGYFKFPYPGEFKLSGRFELDNTSVAQNTWLKGVWIARVYKVKVDGQKVLLQSFAYEHTFTNKPYPGFSFKTNAQTFAAGESALFYIDFQQESTAGGQFITRAPYANFMSWRSYLVLEDANTDAGWKIAESFRKTHGMFYSNGGTAVNTHPTNLDNPSSWPRVYGKLVDLNTVGMHAV